MTEPSLDPPSDVHCPECSKCITEEPQECDYCGHWFHADGPCKETDVLRCVTCEEMSHCCCDGCVVELCDDPALHHLCKACWRKLRDSMEPRV